MPPRPANRCLQNDNQRLPTGQRQMWNRFNRSFVTPGIHSFLAEVIQPSVS